MPTSSYRDLPDTVLRIIERAPGHFEVRWLRSDDHLGDVDGNGVYAILTDITNKPNVSAYRIQLPGEPEPLEVWAALARFAVTYHIDSRNVFKFLR